jgi:hypothetical protein
MEVLGGVLILGVVAAADVPTGEAEAQMDPGVAKLQAFLAASAARRDFLDQAQMAAGLALQST